MVLETLADLALEIIPGFNKPDCLLVKKEGSYRSISSQEVCETVECLAAKLMAMGISKSDRVGILSENRPEWAYADLAIICAGGVSVPIYSTLPATQIDYILTDSEMKILFVSNENQMKKIREIRTELQLIAFDVPSSKNVLALSDALSQGKEQLRNSPAMVKNIRPDLKPDDIFTIVYTSGTTGEPKGVMLTHHNLISNIQASLSIFNFRSQDRHLSFLPLCHIFERMAGHYLALANGCSIAYAENLDSLAKNLNEVQPTILLAVPRVYEKFQARIYESSSDRSKLKNKLAHWALELAEKYTEESLNRKSISASNRVKHKIADMLVYSKIRKKLGGKLRLLISGGAALPSQVAEFFYGLGITILEGYGLTETSPVIACNHPQNFKFGTVGPPLPGVEVRTDTDGELLTRGPHVMKGYFKKPQATADVIDPDGWFHTGDIAEIDSDGFIKITDRKKDLIVTSAGKNIAPQFVENTLKASEYITQIVVLGDGRKFPAALVVPNKDRLKQFARAANIPETDMFRSDAVIAEVQRSIDELSKDLAPFERVKKIAFVENEFTIESGELTPSLKIKRNVVASKYRDVIERLYGS